MSLLSCSSINFSPAEINAMTTWPIAHAADSNDARTVPPANRSAVATRWVRRGVMALATVAVFHATAANAQGIRMKKPDRGTYQPPVSDAAVADDDRYREVDDARYHRSKAGLVDAGVDSGMTVAPEPQLRPVSHAQSVAPDPPSPIPMVSESVPSSIASPTVSAEAIAGDVVYGGQYYGEPACGIESTACDALTCDSGIAGCDSLTCDGCSACRPTGYIVRAPHRWFGSIDLLSMWRKGDRLPPLVTTGSTGNLDDADTTVLAGDRTVFEGATMGGRLMIGTWLDEAQCRSLRFRAWAVGEDTYNFSADESDFNVLTRPFFNVSDGDTPGNETLQIAFPDVAFGSVSVNGSSNVAGADIAVYQPWMRGFAGRVDVLYGYQYMRFDESLRIHSSSTSIDPNVTLPPIGSIIDVTDTFDAENEFHGGQIGLATSHTSGCWSFRSLFKFGFGSLQRGARRSGTTVTSVDGNQSIINEGLLVRSTNSSPLDDNTFGWIPEMDLSLGWHRFPRFDVKFGYHLIAMTDALQVSGMIDPDLAVNSAIPPTGQQSPALAIRTDTIYVHGIHLGLHYSY